MVIISASSGDTLDCTSCCLFGTRCDVAYNGRPGLFIAFKEVQLKTIRFERRKRYMT